LSIEILSNNIRKLYGRSSGICSSSSEVFGRVPKEQVPINENTPFHPASPYAISKVGTDLIGQYFAEAFGLNTITTRMFTHTGPRRGDVFAESSFAKQIAMIEIGLLPPTIMVGNLNSMRTFADVRDAVSAYHLAVTSDLPAGSVYNIGGTHSCTVDEMLQKLISLSTTADIEIEIDPSRLRPIDADLQIPDTSLFRASTSWEPRISFEQTMTDLLNYWRERIVISPSIQR
jgi:GDPmannose 4,6-dehydratase